MVQIYSLIVSLLYVPFSSARDETQNQDQDTF